MNKKNHISSKLRNRISQKFHRRCAYCQSQEENLGTQFTIDHIIPEALGGETVEENLCLACWDCNLSKKSKIAANDPETGQMVALFNPNQQNWYDHFTWDSKGELIIGKTPSGRATVAALHLNRLHLLRARARWIQVGWHPPQ